MARRRKQLETPALATQFEGLRSDYQAARHTRLQRRRRGIPSSGAGADYHYASDADYLRMMEIARDIDRNDMIVGQGIDRLVSNVLQTGFQPNPNTGSTEAEEILASDWRGWSTDPSRCDVAGECDFHALERLTLRHEIVDGDILGLPHASGRLEMVEAHRLRTPSNARGASAPVHGVKMDRYRMPLQYWLTREEISPLAPLRRVRDVKKMPARDGDGEKIVFHVKHPKRITQTRGVTSLAPITDPVGMHDDIQFATLVQRQIVSCFAILRERELEFNSGAVDASPQTGERRTETLGDGSTRTIDGIAPGMEIEGAPGEKLKGFSPDVPSPSFFDHTMMILAFIAVNLNIPVHVLLLDPTKTNFSGWRGAMDQARIGFRELGGGLICTFHSPVWRWRVRHVLATNDRLQALAEKPDVDIYGHEWQMPAWAYMEPLKDATADLVLLRNGMISPRRFHSSRGRRFDVVSQEIVDDHAAHIERAMLKVAELAKKPELAGQEMPHWRDLASLPPADGMTIQVAAGEAQQERES